MLIKIHKLSMVKASKIYIHTYVQEGPFGLINKYGKLSLKLSFSLKMNIFRVVQENI